MKNIITIMFIPLLLNITLSAKGVNALEVDELESYMQKSVVIIDIRDEDKWKKKGILPNSYRLSYINTKKNNNEKKWAYTLTRLVKQKNRAFVLISDNGNKARTLANKLYKEKKYNNVMYLKGGFEAWLDADRKIINF